jgi:ATP-dependent helicase/DNAse subunit B
MTAAVRVLCGPAGSGKTQRLLMRYQELARSAPGAALWLVPTRRGAEQVSDLFLSVLGGYCGPAPRTFAEWAADVIRANDPAARLLSAAQRRLLLDELIARLDAEGELAYFGRVLETRGFTAGVSGLLAELQRADVTPAAFARAAYRQGLAAGISGRTIGGRAILAKDRCFARLFARFVRELRRHNLHDAEGQTWHALALLRRGLRQPFAAVRYVFVDGFSDFTPAQHGILQALAEEVEELWTSLPDEPGEERAELFAAPRAALRRLNELSPRVEWLPSRPLAESIPAGLAHLERQLFRPVQSVEVAEDATGLECIAAPGALGEVRLTARRIKRLLLDGVSGEDVVVTTRDLSAYEGLVREVFAEYGIPAEVEGAEPLVRCPAVGALLRTLRLSEEDWPFAGVTALLRSTYLRPEWPETVAAPELPQQAEALLRLLGEPRGREAYLTAVRRWAERQQPGLEDEEAEQSRRQRIHELAQRCRPFLERFFHAWEGSPAVAPPAEHVAHVRHFADDLGITRAAEEDERDRAALKLLWEELGRWVSRSEPPLDRKAFLRRLATLAAEAGLTRAARGASRVRVVSAESARHLAASYVFILGLGERGFPRLAAPQPLLEEAERLALRPGGVDLACASEQMPGEMLLFYQIATRARRRLVLSFPAVDERGQPLLPSSFLTAALDCFRPGAVPVERRSMLLEGYDSDVPLSPAEYRVRAATVLAAGGALGPGLAPDLRANLMDAAKLVRLRLREKEHNPFDGLFRDPAVIGELQQLFGPERVYSPTALEDYVACPFRFFLRHVLRLEPLEEPREDVEVTRRGQAFHRALARLHRNLKEAGVHEPADEVDDHVRREIAAAVAEDVSRAPGPASKELWRIEGQRLLRLALRYRDHWRRFLAPWQERGIAPRPHLFEVDFGLPAPNETRPHAPLVLRAEGVEVRISGRIDRVDLAELDDGIGFWIIDYKTGHSTSYTSSDLTTFRRLQLTLYAVAAEEVLLAGRRARPLGLAYWLVGESGPKVVLPIRNTAGWLDEEKAWRKVREQLEGWVATLVGHLRRGVFPLHPRSEHCTQTCPFGQVCRITQARSVEKAWELPLPTEQVGERGSKGAGEKE